MFEVFIFITAALIVWLTIIYHLMVQDKVRIQFTWNHIDTQRKQRHKLALQLLTTINQYTSHDPTAISTIIEQCNYNATNNNLPIISDAESLLDSELEEMLLCAESAPELKADQTFIDMQHQLGNIEEKIKAERHDYNVAVKNFNTRLTIFPNSFIARFFHFVPVDYFQANADAKINLAPTDFSDQSPPH